MHLSELQVKVVPVTGVRLDAGQVEYVTNIPVTKTRGHPVIHVIMSSGPLIAELHGSCSPIFPLSFHVLLVSKNGTYLFNILWFEET